MNREPIPGRYGTRESSIYILMLCRYAGSTMTSNNRPQYRPVIQDYIGTENLYWTDLADWALMSFHVVF